MQGEAGCGIHGGFGGGATACLAFLTVLGACVGLVVGPWLRPDLLWHDVADAPNHLVRIYVIDAALGRGEWFPRWLPDLYLGYGYPLLNFYAPAMYYVATALHRLGLTVYAGFQWTGVLAVAAGAGGAYALIGALTARRDAALLAAAIFAFSPYAFLTNLYVRAAVPEAMALALLPWLLLAVWRCRRRGGAWSAALALLVAALLLTHNISALLSMGLLAVWLVVLLWLDPVRSPKSKVRSQPALGRGEAFASSPSVPPPLYRRMLRPYGLPLPGRRTPEKGAGRLRPFVRSLLAIGAGMGLSAFFWLPALVESSLVQIRLAQGDFYDPKNWLFDPLHLLGKSGLPAYAHTRLGPADLSLVFDYGALGQGAPEKISLWQLVLWGVALIVAGGVLAHVWRRGVQRAVRDAWCVVRGGHRDGACTTHHAPTRSRAPAPPSARPLVIESGASDRPQLALLALFWSSVAAGCWFLNTTWSRPLWAGVPLLSTMQFPWRLYGPLALAVAASVGLAFGVLPACGKAGWASRAGAIALLGLLGYGSLAARPVTLGKEPAHDVDARDLAALEFNRYGAGTTSGGEFLPLTVHWEEDQWAGAKRGIRLYEDAYPQAGWQAGLVRVLAGRGAITAIGQQPNRIVADVDAETPITLGVHQLLFPGWRGYVDGRPVDLAPAEADVTVHATLGFIVLAVPAGHHQVEVRFGSTPVRTLATALSAAMLALALLWLLNRVRGPRCEVRSPKLVCYPTLHWLRCGRLSVLGPSSGVRRLPSFFRRLLSAALVLVAAGCAVAGVNWSARPERPLPAGAARVVLDVAGLVARGQAQTFAPNAQGAGVLPPYLDVRYEAIGHEERRWLYLHPPSAVAIHLRVPAHAYFQAGLALDPQTWSTPTGDGVRFILQAEGPSGPVVLLDRHLNPRAREEERRWNDVWVSLAPLAGQDVRLILRTDPAEDTTFDWAGWSNPQVVIWDAARPEPGEEHKW